MKTKVLFLAALFLATMGVCGCSGDDELDAKLDEKALLSQAEPLYKSSSSDIFSLPQTEKKVGDWGFVMHGDYITEVSFYDKAPTSAEAFLEEYLPLTKDNNLKLEVESTSGGSYHKYYSQYYKGVKVTGYNGVMASAGFACYYQPDEKTPRYMQGYFIPISDIDVKPHVSENLARRIAMAYMSKGQKETPGEGWNLSADLRITNYIVDGQPHVHLIYDCTLRGDTPWSSMENVTIDAHTGRILTFWMAIA